MYEIERQEDIVKILKDKKVASVTFLAQALFVSEATIRRDLSKLEQKGTVTRTFGGVVLNSQTPNQETTFELREQTNLNEKRALCQKASSYIKNNYTIFIDSSTTLLNIVNYLNNFENLVIITNGLFVANEIINKTKHQVILPGGLVQANTNSMLGAITLSALNKFHCNLAIMSTSSFDFKFGPTESTIEQAEIKNTMLKNSDLKIVLCDAQKMHKQSLYRTSSLDQIDILITNYKINEEEEKVLESNKITYIRS